MIRAILRCFATRVVLAAAISRQAWFPRASRCRTVRFKGAHGSARVQLQLQIAGRRRHRRVRSMATFTECDNYHIYLARNRSESGAGDLHHLTDRLNGFDSRITSQICHSPVLLWSLAGSPSVAQTELTSPLGGHHLPGPPEQTVLPRTPAAGKRTRVSDGPTPTPKATIEEKSRIEQWRSARGRRSNARIIRWTQQQHVKRLGSRRRSSSFCT